MRIGDIEHLGEREIPMPRFTPPRVEPTPSPLKPAPTREREPEKVFKRFGAKEEILRQARLAAIEGIRDLVIAGAHHVAGGIYDNETPSPVTLRSPIERMKGFLTALDTLPSSFPVAAAIPASIEPGGNGDGVMLSEKQTFERSEEDHPGAERGDRGFEDPNEPHRRQRNDRI
jgi:hypothetical protein